jgi:hypothetical protein
LKLGDPAYLADEEIKLSPLALDRVWAYYCIRAGVDPI